MATRPVRASPIFRFTATVTTSRASPSPLPEAGVNVTQSASSADTLQSPFVQTVNVCVEAAYPKAKLSVLRNTNGSSALEQAPKYARDTNRIKFLINLFITNLISSFLLHLIVYAHPGFCPNAGFTWKALLGIGRRHFRSAHFLPWLTPNARLPRSPSDKRYVDPTTT